MKIITIASQKGGVGKTTIAAHLAVSLAAQGQRVAISDLDPQNSLSAWWNARVAEDVQYLQLQAGQIASGLANGASEAFDVLILDTPPSASAVAGEAIGQAHLVLIPTRASPVDLRALGPTVDVIEGSGKPMVFIINATTPRSKLAGEAAIALSQYGKVAPVQIGQRADYAGAMIDGRTAPELDPKGRAAEEMIALRTYVFAQITKR